MIFDVKYKPLLQGGLRPERWRGVHTPPLPQLYRTQAGWGALFIISACWRGLRFYITILGIFLAQTFEKATVAVKSCFFLQKVLTVWGMKLCTVFSIFLSRGQDWPRQSAVQLWSRGPEDQADWDCHLVVGHPLQDGDRHQRHRLLHLRWDCLGRQVGSTGSTVVVNYSHRD